MPRLFNRIRKQLAKENKFFQYSRYAIVEILLAVIRYDKFDLDQILKNENNNLFNIRR